MRLVAEALYEMGDQVIAEYEGSTLKRKFIYSPGIDEPLRQAQGRHMYD